MTSSWDPSGTLPVRETHNNATLVGVIEQNHMATPGLLLMQNKERAGVWGTVAGTVAAWVYLASCYATCIGRYYSLTHLLLVTTPRFPLATNTSPACLPSPMQTSQKTSATARPIGPGHKPTRPEAHCQLVLLVITACFS